jgi:phage tail-like protein
VKATGVPAAPASASQRAYMRDGLPSVYLEGDFGMRFVGALEGVLDPIVSTLDCLPAHICPELAPDHLLSVLGTWLGLVIDEDLSTSVRRNLVCNASGLMRFRGTVAGLQLMLTLTFPQLGLRVEDGGGVTTFDGVPTPPESSAGFTVRSPVPLDPSLRAALVHVIDRERPVHVTCRIQEPEGDTYTASAGASA